MVQWGWYPAILYGSIWIWNLRRKYSPSLAANSLLAILPCIAWKPWSNNIFSVVTLFRLTPLIFNTLLRTLQINRSNTEPWFPVGMRSDISILKGRKTASLYHTLIQLPAAEAGRLHVSSDSEGREVRSERFETNKTSWNGDFMYLQNIPKERL